MNMMCVCVYTYMSIEGGRGVGGGDRRIYLSITF